MAQDHPAEEDRSPKSRIRSLFKFLYEVNRLRYRPERTLQEQVSFIPLTQLPEHPCIQLVRPVAAEGQPPVEFELKITRARSTRCPEPPSILRDWLISGWDDPTKEPAYAESVNDVTEKGESITIAFADDPERTDAWGQWTATRKAWVEPEIQARVALAFFEKFYELYALLEKDGEQLELVVADGMLNWQVRSVMENVEVRIQHPVLLKRVELSFDPSKPEFRVVDTDRETELYTSFLIDLEGHNASGITARQRELDSAIYHPMGFADTQAFMTALVQTISPTHGQFVEEPGNGFEPHPRLWREPVLLVRRRVQGITNAISRIIDDIERKEVFPSAFGQIVGMPNEWKSVAETEAHQGGIGGHGDPSVPPVAPPIEDDEILLAKETNEEQMQIIRRLESSGSVLVQGPPGTGKTHTIANIIGHLLAKGKTVLVTSHTPKALRVLRDQIPEDLRPLCVSAVGGDRESRRQLEAAITEINVRLARSSVETLRNEIVQRVKERRKILEENRRLTAKLREALESEYREISSQGKAFTPSEAARHVKRSADASSWLPGPIAGGATLPLSREELSALYATNIEFDAAEERDAGYALPALDGLMTATYFRPLIQDIESLLALNLADKSELWGHDTNVSSGHLGKLIEDLRTEFPEQRKSAWRPYAIVAGIQGGAQRQVWATLVDKIMKASGISAQ